MKPCALVRDLLPLFVDGAVSDESRSFIEEHLKGCDACRRELDALRAPLYYVREALSGIDHSLGATM